LFAQDRRRLSTTASFQENIAFGNGGAIDCAGLPQTSITKCAFEGNSGTLGGGLHIGNAGAAVSGCSFSNNVASKGGQPVQR
jgi:predicted outer membrane repeat protein